MFLRQDDVWANFFEVQNIRTVVKEATSAEFPSATAVFQVATFEVDTAFVNARGRAVALVSCVLFIVEAGVRSEI